MGKALPYRLILASGSAARRALLEQAGYSFTISPSNIAEPCQANAGPRCFVHEVAWQKAAAVAPQIAEGVVLAADTVAWLHGGVIGKPVDQADARRILRLLGGTTHDLWTGVVLWRRPDDLQIVWQECSRVRFHALSDKELDAYIASRQWEGCSGAYAIQDGEDPYVRVVDGSRSNVIGLPMETLERILPVLPLL